MCSSPVQKMENVETVNEHETREMSTYPHILFKSSSFRVGIVGSLCSSSLSHPKLEIDLDCSTSCFRLSDISRPLLCSDVDYIVN